MDKSVNLLSSEDEENDDSMPKIVSSISLKDCSSPFNDEADDNSESDLSPSCEINDEPSLNYVSNKRVELKHLGAVEHKKVQAPKPSTSMKINSHHVVDTKRLALQESLFKTKEHFDTFLRVCQDKESSENMERVTQKLTRAYECTRQEFLGSVAFQDMLKSETDKVNTSNSLPWLNLKLILDEMKHNKKLSSKLKSGESEESQQDARATGSDNEPFIECPKKRKRLKILEKTLRALNLKIKSLEEREVDFSDDDDSAYLMLDRYRAQFIKVYNKICQFKGKLADADRPYMRKVAFAGTTYPHINRCIEKFYNKHRVFPDFLDIQRLVVESFKQEDIVMAPIKVHQIAMNAFKEFGEMLKRLRQYDDYDVMVSYLDQQVDPARDDMALQEELNRNALLFKKKEQEVIDRFAEKGSGFPSGDENSSDDGYPKKKKRKFTLKSPKRNAQKLKRASSESSETSEEEDKKVKPLKKKAPPQTLSSSEEDGESEPKKEKESVSDESVTVDKGKSLIGKKKLIKRGVPKESPLKQPSTSTTISSDENSTLKDSKNTFTDYLGLQVKSDSEGHGEKVVEKLRVESDDDEIVCVQDIKTSPTKNILKKREDNLNNSVKSKSLVLPKTSSTNRLKKIISNEKIHSCEDDADVFKINDSDSEPELFQEKACRKNIRINNKPNNESHKKGRNLCSNGNTGESRTSSESKSSDEESEDGQKKKILSDLELSGGTKELSSSSDIEGADVPVVEKSKTSSGANNAIIEIIEESKTTNKNTLSVSSQDSIDSDDIIILSQETSQTNETTKKPNLVSNANSARPNKLKRTLSKDNRNLTISGRPSVLGTPTGQTTAAERRKSSNISLFKTNRLQKITKEQSISGNGSKQVREPQTINGASRKVIISRVCGENTTKKPQNAIPLIELD